MAIALVRQNLFIETVYWFRGRTSLQTHGSQRPPPAHLISAPTNGSAIYFAIIQLFLCNMRPPTQQQEQQQQQHQQQQQRQQRSLGFVRATRCRRHMANYFLLFKAFQKKSFFTKKR